MYKYRLTTVRTSADVAFYQNPNEVTTHINTVYKDSGIMTVTETIEVDDLITTKVIEFTSEEAFNNFKNDPIIAQNIEARKAYELEKGIFRWKEIIQ